MTPPEAFSRPLRQKVRSQSAPKPVLFRQTSACARLPKTAGSSSVDSTRPPTGLPRPEKRMPQL